MILMVFFISDYNGVQTIMIEHHYTKTIEDIVIIVLRADPDYTQQAFI